MSWWNKYWYEGHGSLDKENLALFRIFFYLLLIPIFYFSVMHTPGNFDDLFYQPVFFFKPFNSIHQSLEAFKLACYGFYLFSFFCIVGIATPISNKIVPLCAFYVFAPIQNYGGYQHLGSTFIMGMLVMAFAKSNHAYSIDNWIARKWNISWIKMEATTLEYVWPLKLIQFIWCFIFFSSGFLKIYTSGADWLRFNMIGIFLVRFNSLYQFNMSNNFSTSIRDLISEHYWIGRTGTLFALLLELSMPLMLFHRRYVYPLLTLALIFLFSMMIIMGHHFWYTLSPYLLTILFLQVNLADKFQQAMERLRK